MKWEEIEDTTKRSQVMQLEDFIMKTCLWQFHSREWDRYRQNENILGQATSLLCGEPVDTSTGELKCYWVDAVSLVDNFKKKYTWINGMSNEQKKEIMGLLKARIDYTTITGSLNEELTVKLY
jgi:nitrogenase delta subunit